MDELKNQLDFTVDPDQNEPEQEDGVMDDCNSGSGSDSKSGSINRKSSKKNRLKIRIKIRKSEDCNGESGTVSNETRSFTMNHVSGGAKNRVKAEHHGCTKGEGIEELPNYGKRRRFKVKTQLKNHRRRSKLRLINLEFTNMEEKAWSGKSVTDESSEENDDDSSPARPICSLCGKNFPSMKSLFGHMRCHPDRDWRGMVPPEKNSSPSSAVSDSGPNFTRNREEKTGDQVSSLLGWSVTARRGRRSTISESSELSDDQISYAAYHLMMLAYADSGEENRKESEGRNMEFGNLGCLEEVKRRKTDETDGVFRSKSVKKIGENKLVYRSEQRKRKRKIRTLEKVQNLGLIDSNLNAVLAQKYRCSTCSKSFSSHQALGGHRASHKKRRNTSYPLRGVDEFTVDEVAEEEDSLMADLTHIEHSPESGNEPCPEVDTVHRCQICNRGFPTGQALGGHKRCHWTGARSTMADLAAASSVTSVVIPKDGRKSALGLPDFDLNKPPMVEEEDLDSAISMIDVVHASSQPPGLNSKDHGLVYCNYVI